MSLSLLFVYCFLFVAAAHNHGGNDLVEVHGRHFCGVKDLTEVQFAQREEHFSRAFATKSASILKEASEATKNNHWKNVTIPVYFNVIQSTGGNGEVKKKRVHQLLDIINEKYMGTGFKFQLKELSYHVNDRWFYQNEYDNEVDMKVALRVGDSMTLNIYTARLPGNLLGWATFPFNYEQSPMLDGVVVDFDSLPGGGIDGYTDGKVTVHEIGHWLGLFHTFQGGCNANVNQGDGVADTPAERSPNGYCDSRNSCTGIFFPGDDPINNYMDYTYPKCVNTFTKGQIERMQKQFTAYRA